jgi:murein DD-endopeptidase MepM/ murein hydrolase activator NlpD
MTEAYWGRRAFVAGLVALPAMTARADDAVRFTVTGTMEQGSLALGQAPPGSTAALDGRPLRVMADGRFVFGFEPSQTRASLVTVRYPDGGGDSRSFTPAKRQYDIQRVNGLPQETVTPPPEVTARIEREAAAIYLARLEDSGGDGDFLHGFDWPAPGILSGVFGSQRIDNGTPMAPHFGVDMANVEGTPIRAPAGAVVALTDDFYLEGGFTLLDHGHGVFTHYMHQSRRLVNAGDTVARGDVIGHIGKTGRATGPHLHWGMNWFQMRLDPSLWTAADLPPRA